jgi:hypothetical protein
VSISRLQKTRLPTRIHYGQSTDHCAAPLSPPLFESRMSTHSAMRQTSSTPQPTSQSGLAARQASQSQPPAAQFSVRSSANYSPLADLLAREPCPGARTTRTHSAALPTSDPRLLKTAAGVLVSRTALATRYRCDPLARTEEDHTRAMWEFLRKRGIQTRTTESFIWAEVLLMRLSLSRGHRMSSSSNAVDVLEMPDLRYPFVTSAPNYS